LKWFGTYEGLLRALLSRPCEEHVSLCAAADTASQTMHRALIQGQRSPLTDASRRPVERLSAPPEAR